MIKRFIDRARDVLAGDRERALVSLATLIALFLHVIRLDHGFLWRDEGETLLLGRFTLAWGMPKAFDDAYTVCSNLAITPKGWFVFLPWFQNYLAAFALALGKDDLFLLRLPFALFGAACVPLLWQVTKSFRLPVRIRLAACALLAVNVPFTLWNRNIRYYSQAAFFPLLLTWTYLRIIREKGKGWLLYAVVGFLTLHALGPLALAPFVALHLSLLLYHRADRRLLRAFGMAHGVILLAYLPYFLEAISGLRHFLNSYGGSLLGKQTTFALWLSGAALHGTYLIEYGFPSLLLIVLVVRKMRGLRSWSIGAEASLFFAVQGVGAALFASFIYNTQIAPPYVQAAIPFVAILSASAIDAAAGRSKVAFLTLLAMVGLTTGLNLPLWLGHSPRLRDEVSYYRSTPTERFVLLREHLFMRHIRIPLWNYARLLRTRRVGPLEGLAQFLREHGKSGQTFYATADVQATHFVTGYRRIDRVPFSEPPDWVIWRNRRSGCSLGMGVCEVAGGGACLADRTVRQFLQANRYEEIVLPYPDWSQENLPVLEFLLDWDESNDRELDPLVIFRRPNPAANSAANDRP